MIGSLRGTLLQVLTAENPELLLEVEGVGYRVSVGRSAISQMSSYLGDGGAEVFLYVSHQVREDSETLYGFLDPRDREAFETLLKIHKVGPALAMDILDSYSMKQLQEIVIRKDLDALTSISGVGKTTAERLLTELKNKLDVEDFITPEGKDGETDSPSQIGDVRKALLELGYSNAEIRDVFGELSTDLDTEELLKQSLALLGPSTES